LGSRLFGLRIFSAGLETCAQEGWDRMTVSQLLFFCAVAEADLMGQDVTFTNIKDRLGSSISRSLHSTYKTLLEPRGRTNENGVGWLSAEPNPHDLREKFLRMTIKGREIAASIQAAHA